MMDAKPKHSSFVPSDPSGSSAAATTSIATATATAQPGKQADRTTSQSSLASENEQLRRQLEDLQALMNSMRQQMQHHGVPWDVPPTIVRKGTTTTKTGTVSGPASTHSPPPTSSSAALPSALNCLKHTKREVGSAASAVAPPAGPPRIPAPSRGLPKDRQSFSTQDDQETVEPRLDLDAHESGKGLKHRTSQTQMSSKDASPKRPAHYSVTSADDITRKTEPLSSNDGSLSSKDDVDNDVDDDDDEDLMVVDVDDDDDDGTGWSNEAHELLRLSTSSHAPRTRGIVLVNSNTDDIENRPHHNNRSNNIQDEPFWSLVSDRARWLVGLLVFQSMSSFILARNEALLQQHTVIVRFLTMLVGAGGNAGNQASVRVIRGLAVGSITDSNTARFFKKEMLISLALSVILAVAGCIRAAVFLTPWLETAAITTSLFMIVIISIFLGALLPLGMKRLGIDPAHSSTTIQVVMDITGVTITVWMSALVLDSGFHNWLLSMMTDAR